jgi:hypothetical protein
MGVLEERDIIFLPEDREICKALLEKARERGDSARSVGDLIVEVGLHFLGAPYEAGTLERKGPEGLVVNLRTFDCVTFVENAVVLAGMIRAGKTAFGDYAAALERIRYRGGRRDGYPSRLHYFTDWLWDNGRKGVIREITCKLGGIPFRKAFHELTDHREDHPPLRAVAAFRRMRIVEAICSRRTLHCVPKTGLPGIEKRIKDGDIIAIVTDADGIDVSHTGIAIRLQGRLHLLHASSSAGRVTLSNITLHRYLQARRARMGIIVGRATPRNHSEERNSGSSG